LCYRSVRFFHYSVSPSFDLLYFFICSSFISLAV
jgi:hypothetical protein